MFVNVHTFGSVQCLHCVENVVFSNTLGCGSIGNVYLPYQKCHVRTKGRTGVKQMRTPFIKRPTFQNANKGGGGGEAFKICVRIK